jgi:hypothetical protein
MADDTATCLETFPRVVVDYEIQIALTVDLLVVRETMPLLG